MKCHERKFHEINRYSHLRRNTVSCRCHLHLCADGINERERVGCHVGRRDKKVDKSAGKLTIKHGQLKNLGMDAMTMVFKVKDPAMLDDIKVGDKINFVAEQPNGQLTVTTLEKQQ